MIIIQMKNQKIKKVIGGVSNYSDGISYTCSELIPSETHHSDSEE